MVWGPVCDRWGRRLAFLSCLFILSVSCVGLALTPTNAYWLLLVLRCVQAFGSASTIAIGKTSCFSDMSHRMLTTSTERLHLTGAGVIADIAAQSERAGFFGLYTIGPVVRIYRRDKYNSTENLYPVWSMHCTRHWRRSRPGSRVEVCFYLFWSSLSPDARHIGRHSGFFVSHQEYGS